MSSAPKLTNILVYGSDELLLGTRTMVSGKAGYVVFFALEASDVEQIIVSENISLLVLCHTLSAEKSGANSQRAGSP